MEVIERYEHAGVTVEIVPEEDTSFCDPQQNDNAGHIVLWGAARDYTIGDDQIHEPDLSEDCPVCDGEGTVDGSSEPTAPRYDQRTCERCEGDGFVQVTLEQYFRRHYEAALVIPLQFVDGRYDGRLFILEDAYDGYNGVIYFTHAEIEQEWKGRITGDSSATAYAQARIKEYDNYLQGNCLGIRVLDAEDQEQESVWGFICDWWDREDRAYVKAEADAMAEGVARRLEHERREQFEWACRDVETVA